MNSNRNNSGFTIIELMIATTIFSVILLLATVAILQIGKTYYRGVNFIRTQNAGRAIIDNISQNIQFGGLPTTPKNTDYFGSAFNATSFFFCVGTQRYSYTLGRQLVGSVSPANASVQSTHVLLQDKVPSGCPDPKVVPPPTDAKELLGPRMSLAWLITCSPGDTSNCPSDNAPPVGSKLYKIKLRLVLGDQGPNYLEDNFNQFGIPHDPADPPEIPVYDSCKLGPGSQFCAVAPFTTVVEKRL